MVGRVSAHYQLGRDDVGKATMDPASDRRLWNLEFGKEVPIPGFENRLPNPVIIRPA